MADNQPNNPIDMGPFLGAGGVVPDNPTPLSFQSGGQPPSTKGKAKKASVQSDPPAPSGGNSFIQAGPGGVPVVPEVSDVDAYQQGDLGAGIKPKDRWEKFWAQAGLGFNEDAPTPNLMRFRDQMQLEFKLQGEGRSKLSADAANKLYPGLEKPFSEPVYPEVAKLIADAHTRRAQLRAWIDKGPETGTLFNFAAGAAVGADPLNVIVGGMLGNASRALGLASKLKGALPARYGISALAGPATVFGENLAANAVGEGAAAIQRPNEQRKNPSLGELAANVTAGAAFGTGLHLLFSKLSERAHEAVEGKSRAQVEDTTRAVVNQLENGEKVNVAPSTTLETLRDSGFRRGVSSEYQFERLKNPAETVYHVPVDPETGRFSASEDMGGGVSGSDNPAVAVNYAGLPERGINGEVYRARPALTRSSWMWSSP
jgi:hypothetical protein